MKEIDVKKEQEGQRLNKFLGKYLDAAPQSFLYRMMRKKNIKYNNAKASGNEILKSGDTIQIYMSDDTILHFRKDGAMPELQNKGQASGCRLPGHTEGKMQDPLRDLILYEDADVLILNKPEGILSQKARPEDVSLNEQIVAYYREKDGMDPLFTPSVCNRLDRNTSGLILAGMSLKGARELSAMLKQRTLHKWYLTIVSGRIENATTIKGFLTKQEAHNQVRIYETKQEACQKPNDKPAYIETRYEPLAYGSLQGTEFTLLKVQLITGKTHQIRAHLQYAGHPIVGDGKYGLKSVNAQMKKAYGLKHQLLHAYCIEMPAQNTGLLQIAGRVFYAPVPERFWKIGAALFGEKMSQLQKEGSHGNLEF